MATDARIVRLGPLAAAIARFRPPSANIRGIDTADWMGPLQPVRPWAPPGTSPRGWQYAPGQNLVFTPRAQERLTAERLRTLADYPLVRMIIEGVKDQIVVKRWQVRLRRMPGESTRSRLSRDKQDKRIPELTGLLENPNPDADWRDWLRALLDDAMVIDAPAVLMRKSATGSLVELRHIDGATISRYIDENGWTPRAPSPGYAQLWYGTPMVDLTTEQLLYRPRNVRSYKLYGMSPTEAIAEIIRIGIDRMNFRKAYYAEGSVPDGMMIVPPGVAPDQIREAQDWISSDLAGQLAKRRQMRLIQGFSEQGKDQVFFPKAPLLKDEYDDYELSVLCYAYGASRQRLVRQLSRGAAKQSQDAAEEEGLEPWLDWVTSLANRILRHATGSVNYEFVFRGFRETDVVKQAQADASDVKFGIRSINEVREDRGYEPRPEKSANSLGVITINGFMPLDQPAGVTNGNPARSATAMGGTQPQPSGTSGGGAGRHNPASGAGSTAGEHPASGDASTRKAAKADAAPAPGIEIASQALTSYFAGVLAVLEMAASDAGAAGEDQKSREKRAALIVAALAGFHGEVPPAMETLLRDSFLGGAGSDAPDVQVAAAEYAAARVAAMESQSGNWSVAAATSRGVQTILASAEANGWTAPETAAALQASSLFGAGRARLIAANEAAMARAAGALAAWKADGKIVAKQWVLGPLHARMDECDGNARAGEIALDQAFPSGVVYPPAHPWCGCSVRPIYGANA